MRGIASAEYGIFRFRERQIKKGVVKLKKHDGQSTSKKKPGATLS
jgi:hypothetical protein